MNPTPNSFSKSHIRGSVTAVGPAGALSSGAGLPFPSGVLGAPARTGMNAEPRATRTGTEAAGLFPLRRSMPSEISPPIILVTDGALLGKKAALGTVESVVLGVCA